MAQLTSDSFAFGGALRRLDEALADLAQRLHPVTGVEAVLLMAAQGRILAAEAIAGVDVPAFDNSAVDGYAVRFADLAPEGETRLPVVARIAAGQRDVLALMAGEAVQIFTGAMLPPGADTVFMQEDVRREGGDVVLPAGLKPGSNRRFAGEDFKSGALMAPAGTLLRPQMVAALAAIGLHQVNVRARLRVGVFSTGDEIVPAGNTLGPGCQYDSNRALLHALLAKRGMIGVDLGILPDNREVIAQALLDGARHCDVLLTSGGVSTGEEDHVKAAISAAGRLDFWRLAIKPGRPVALGFVEGKPFIGLPGNPGAVFVTFVRFAGPVLDMLAGASPYLPLGFPVRADFAYQKKADRREYVRASLVFSPDGTVKAQRYPREGAALLSSLIETHGLIELPEEVTRIAPGDQVRFISYAEL